MCTPIWVDIQIFMNCDARKLFVGSPLVEFCTGRSYQIDFHLSKGLFRTNFKYRKKSLVPQKKVLFRVYMLCYPIKQHILLKN